MNKQAADEDKIRQTVKKAYGEIARRGASGCSCSASSECCPPVDHSPSSQLGYSEEELKNIPPGANMGLGCGNPQAIAALQPGETVLDLGSGAGIDCFLAARQVGQSGRVLGIDMTREMVDKAKEYAQKNGYANIEFCIGEIERLPIGGARIDVILSNCVINLSPRKAKVFSEVFRALKPGGRLAISDVVATARLPEEIRNDPQLYAACIAGAASIDALEDILAKAGFKNIRIQPQEESRRLIHQWAPQHKIEKYIVSATIEAAKPN